ncbi:hypothetical protein [Aquipuribacter sp. MA13-6]|uniref:hypothetical protein n=1 Tax=unclassified Aquipuribacter TaxID=2635084 RepID=UPI003EE84C1B
MSRATALVLALAGALVLTSCSLTGGQEEPGAAAGPVATEGPVLVEGMRDGTWPVADVGEIEFTLTGRGLALVGMRPAEGWEVVDEEVGPDEIEIDLRNGDVRTTVEVGYQSGILEIEVDQLLDPPPDGPLQLGEAGSVELVVEGDRVLVGDVSVRSPWRETQRSEHAGDAELGLRRNRTGAVETWEVDAWVDDGGLEVATDYEIQGLASP